MAAGEGVAGETAGAPGAVTSLATPGAAGVVGVAAGAVAVSGDVVVGVDGVVVVAAAGAEAGVAAGGIGAAA
jgi:hypothetical protein